MTKNELFEMVHDLMDAGEMHGMDISDAVDFCNDGSVSATDAMEIEDMLYNGEYFND